MNDENTSADKAETLRDAAEGFRRLAASGVDAEMNRTLAALLEARAARIAAGGDDHSDIPLNGGRGPVPS